MSVLLLRLFLLIASTANCLIVRTSFGDLDGSAIGEFRLFKKIPFATPPLGNLRFQKPQLPEKWEGVRDAREYGPACMQNSSVSSTKQKWVDEDCLHLNIFTSTKCLKSKNCPVVTYIHGGGVQYDSSVMFNDTVLLGTFTSQDVVLVIPGFRLGIFSHFVVQDQSIAPTNLALYDILHALQFVNSEIRNFGGDPGQVSIMGHSYGGSITSIMTFSTRINQDLSLFQRTISMSSAHDFEDLDLQLEKTQRFIKEAKCVHDGKNMSQSERDGWAMKCLQKMSGSELLRIQRSLEDQGFPPYAFLTQRGPLMDEVPYSEFMNQPKQIPMLTGCTRYEMDHQPADKPIGEAIGFRNPDAVDRKYRRDLKDEKFKFLNHADETQAIMVQSMLKVETLTKHGIPIYLYEYTYPKHARHTDDLFYLMGVHRFEKDENEEHLALVYKKIFINFVKFGNPKEGFELANFEKSTYFDVFWNVTSGEKPKMKEGFEKDIITYWFKDMVAYDKSIWQNTGKTISPRFYKFSDAKHRPFLLVSLIFVVTSSCLAGCIFGRCYWYRPRRDVYIRLEGNNYNNRKPYREC